MIYGTSGNVDDRNLKLIFPLVKNIYDKLSEKEVTSVNLCLKAFMKSGFSLL
ncbi:hypothetical protein LEP1GSC137_1891 [Leptospira borgpetersenii str. Noumea 25]|uniref:Uncharacterized protein n=1 Tax=Leptospira borgpetersenii serovar Ballum TaxID=280505 RepID=A0A0S2IN60_LEPBO|nr:hypothetical protein LBBP_00774 [Leptospira borgpetersenii serovar Ballum]EKR00259.1 hypothetical protein LEP1GSC121_3494 [Leptospira borgpetersenii serovar Castellonis str. 200801910]EMO08480.1 hypothetical protein LEP1GSC137_1891 [Leptospira borgpetersenii str. Noumea 25]